MRLFRAVGRLIEPHVRWLFTKQWSLINSVKALPQKCRVRFEMGMSDEGRIESFQELSFGEIRCRILIRSIFVQGLSPSRLEVSPLRLVLEETYSYRLSGVESPLGLKESPSGLKESPSGLKESPSGLKESPSGLEASLAGLKAILARLKENISWREESCVRLNEKFSKAKDTSLLGLKQIDLLENCALETETLIGETSLKAVVETFSEYVSLNVDLEPVSKLNVRLNLSESPKLRLTIRNIGKWPKGKQRSREREPYRVPVKKVLQIMKRRKLREKLKRYLRLFTPSSASLNSLAANFKLWYVNYIYRSNCFFSRYFRIRKVQNSVPRCTFHLYDHGDAVEKKASHVLPHKNLLAVETYGGYRQSICDNDLFPFCARYFAIFCVVFPLSGNKKPPPAKSVGRPFHNESNPDITFVSDPINIVVEIGISDESKLAIITSVPDPGSLLKNRLNQFRLQPLDVGGLGDCFFRAVSHQLYGDPNSHVYIRMSGVEYMKDNPERFIESNTESCWIEYLSNMAKQGTWADGLIIQAVADKFDLKIHIVETNPGFAEFNVIQAVNPCCELRFIYLGHMGEYHYVSSVPLDQCPDNLNKKAPTLVVTKRPVQSQNMLPISSVLDPFSLLNNRFNKIGFQPLDVGGLGDCFFRAISHQLYGDPNGHVYIRMSGVEYMKDNPERFIESNTENCWMEYLSNMAKQGTWADGLIIQAVADKFYLKIHIVETNPGFAEFNVVQAVNPPCEPRLVYLGHVGKYHYVSSVPLAQYADTLEDQASMSTTEKCKKRKLNDNIRQKRNKYMKELMRRKREVTSQQTQTLKKNKGKSQKKQEKPEQSIISNYNNNQIIHQLILKFQDIVSKGPVYICTCCDQLWYKHSVSSTVSIKASNPSITKYLLNTRSEGNVEWLCKTCYNYLKKDKVPPCAAVNGMQFPPKPSFFDLNELECRLLAPRLAFQKLMEAPRGQQLKIHGNIVNVPADVANTVSSLPRLPNETGTIKVNLKRKLQYKRVQHYP